jgi:hypothetical protein
LKQLQFRIRELPRGLRENQVALDVLGNETSPYGFQVVDIPWFNRAPVTLALTDAYFNLGVPAMLKDAEVCLTLF